MNINVKVIRFTSFCSVVFALLTYLTFPVITLGVLVGVSLVLKKTLPKFWSLINGAR